MKKLSLLALLVCFGLAGGSAQAEDQEFELQSVDALESELVEAGIDLDELSALDEEIMAEFLAMETGETTLDGEFDILRRRGGPGMRPGRPGNRPPRFTRPGRPGYRPGPIVRPGYPGPLWPRPGVRPGRPWRPFPPIVRPRPPIYPGYPTGPVTCYAENARGHRFEAWGFRPGIVQDRAMNECYAYSRICYRLGCDARRHWYITQSPLSF
ncbi:MAG: hypothetical protein KDD43_12170, partial [Bdellovibrionales bacterium]|nr:hypothetical protein [Bdellovibrionales bacterium]